MTFEYDRTYLIAETITYSKLLDPYSEEVKIRYPEMLWVTRLLIL